MNGIRCSKCNSDLGRKISRTSPRVYCDVCGSELRISLFNAYFRKKEPPNSGGILMNTGDASCFFHHNKQAVVPCDSCGRFICALCDIEMDGRHICPNCLEKTVDKKKTENFENRRVLYDSMALSLAIVPMFFFFVVVLTAPIVWYITIRYWKSPGSIVGRTKIRFIVAFIIAGFQIAGAVFVIGNLIIH